MWGGYNDGRWGCHDGRDGVRFVVIRCTMGEWWGRVEIAVSR